MIRVAGAWGELHKIKFHMEFWVDENTATEALAIRYNKLIDMVRDDFVDGCRKIEAARSIHPVRLTPFGAWAKEPTNER